MHWSDLVERLGRAVLWLTLASVFVMVPIAVLQQHRTDDELREAARKAEEKIAELAKKDDGPARLQLASMGPVMRALNVANAEGHAWFTNVSPRAGVVCAAGTATNSTTNQTARSLPACEQVAAYASVHLKVMFAGSELSRLCDKPGACDIELKDVPDRSE